MILDLRRWAQTCMLVALVAGCAQTEAKRPAVDTNAVHAAVDSIGKGFSAAVAGRDTDAVVSYYSEDARILPPHQARVEGHAGAHTLWAGFLQLPGVELTLQTKDLEIAQSGELAVETGTYTMKYQGQKGPVSDIGKYVTVYKKVGDDWKILVDTFNSDAPMPPA